MAPVRKKEIRCPEEGNLCRALTFWVQKAEKNGKEQAIA